MYGVPTTITTIAAAETTSINEDDKALSVAKGWYEKKEMLWYMDKQ